MSVVPEAGTKGTDKWLHPTDTTGCKYLSLITLPDSGTTPSLCHQGHLSKTNRWHKHFLSILVLFFGGNKNIYLYFISFLNIDMWRVVEILPQVRREDTYCTESISWGLVSCDAGSQSISNQDIYSVEPDKFGSRTLRVNNYTLQWLPLMQRVILLDVLKLQLCARALSPV